MLAAGSDTGSGARDLQALNRLRSRALQSWLAVMVSVLSILWLETSRVSHKSYNLFLSGDSGLLGAQVYIDDKLIGSMSSSGGTGLGGSVFYGLAGNGPHHIVVLKRGFQPFVKDIDMHGEDYINVELNGSL